MAEWQCRNTGCGWRGRWSQCCWDGWLLLCCPTCRDLCAPRRAVDAEASARAHVWMWCSSLLLVLLGLAVLWRPWNTQLLETPTALARQGVALVCISVGGLAVVTEGLRQSTPRRRHVGEDPASGAGKP